MVKVNYLGQKISPEVERGLGLLYSYGYEIKKSDKGYFEILKEGRILGYTKNSPNWIDPIRDFKRELGGDSKVFDLFREFIIHLNILDIPYPSDKKGTGVNQLTNLIERTLGETFKTQN